MAIFFPSTPEDGDVYTSGGRDYFYHEASKAWKPKAQDATIFSSDVVHDGVAADVVLNQVDFRGRKNYLINSRIEINQRNITSGLTSAQFAPDHFYFTSASAATGGVNNTSDFPGFTKVLTNSEAGSTSWRQAVELPAVGSAGDFNVGSKWILSQYVIADRSIAIDTWLQFQSEMGGGNTVEEGRTTHVLVANVPKRIHAEITIQSGVLPDSNAIAALLWSPSTAIIESTGWQLERAVGNQVAPTSLEYVDATTDLLRCQRYYSTMSIYARLSHSYFTNMVHQSTYHMPVKMRVAPTIGATGDYLVGRANLTADPTSAIALLEDVGPDAFVNVDMTLLLDAEFY